VKCLTNKIRVLLVVILTTLSLVATAQERIALIIGNADYETSPLVTTINDASEMASALSNLGFSVTHLADANHEQMLQAIEEFGDKLHEDSVGLFYYAGHAAQIKDNNYLVPINNGHINSSFKLRSSSVTSQSIQELMVESGSKVNFIFLDSCRNIPSWDAIKGLEEGLAKTEGIESEDEAQLFDDESDNNTDAERGIGAVVTKTKKVKTAKGMLISFSTNPGNTASDGSGNHSPYTKHLLEQINKPNLQVEMMLKAVQAGVEDETNGQIPWYESSIIGSFCFNVVKDGCAKTIVVGIPFLEGVDNIEQVELEDGSSYVGQIIGSNTPQGKGVMTLANGDQLEGEWHSGDISQGKITIVNGGTYEGEIQSKQMHGKGVFSIGTNLVYQGWFKGGKFNGYGTIKLPGGDSYKGEFVNGLREGRGLYVFASGESYEGEWKAGFKDGYGVMISENGAQYEGEFKKDKRHGKGVETYANNRYEGEFANDERNGQGVAVFLDNGQRYEGVFKDGDFVSGTTTWASGAYMAGNFINRRLEGKGVYYHPELGRYEGQFINNQYNGYGIYIWSDGSRYEGEFKNHNFHGIGVRNYINGGRYEGEWKNSSRDGVGSMTWANGSSYKGEWQDDLVHGTGLYVDYNAIKYFGKFEHEVQEGVFLKENTEGGRYTVLFEKGREMRTSFLCSAQNTYNQNLNCTKTLEKHWEILKWQELNYQLEKFYWNGGHLSPGIYNGTSTMMPHENISYEGELKDRKPEGQGILIWPDGSVYKGFFKDGERSGYGVLIRPDGSRYEGEWKDDEKNGHGEEFLPNGVKYEGEFLNNLRHGAGVVTYIKGREFSGMWLLGEKHGVGTLFISEGVSRQQVWENGTLISSEPL